ncbi:CpaF family protein [Candidatus Kaiserbacteria bacterium]|nr:CpaF family protein [Candidatus Kaiserbacteria bacterium]
MTAYDLFAPVSSVSLDAKAAGEISAEVSAAVRTKYPVEVLRSPTDSQREEIKAEVGRLTASAIRRRGLSGVSYADEQKLADTITGRLVGLGFLDRLLPPARRDISEIALDPFGVIWIKRKGRREFEPVPELQPDVVEVDTVFSSLFGQQLKAYSEANPSVNAVLPRTKHNPGGGRIKYIHPVIAQGAGYPSVNIRLFEPEPVKPETLLEWGMLDESTLDILAGMIRRSMRGFIVGGTSSGKTTLLSMLCNFLRVSYRVMTIEDPQEIWIDNPHVVTLQARPASAGSELKSYLLRDGVDDAMRMTPDYLVVGEVRDGQAAQGLFRAMMSDHPGMSTFHAESPELAVERIALLLEADTGTGQRSARKMFASAVDWLLQIGFDPDGKRRVMELVEVSDRLKDGEVQFRRLATYAGGGQWSQLGQPERKRTHTIRVPASWRDVLALDAETRAQLKPVLDRRRAAFISS